MVGFDFAGEARKCARDTYQIQQAQFMFMQKLRRNSPKPRQKSDQLIVDI
jgi:hypothetical protein